MAERYCYLRRVGSFRIIKVKGNFVMEIGLTDEIRKMSDLRQSRELWETG